jgi:hypothetical protein
MKLFNLNGQKPDDGVSSLLQRGLNYAVTPRSVPIEDILAGVEKAVQSLPVEMAEESRQETARIIKSSSTPRDNVARTERAALKTLKKNTNLTILPADKGNATLILNTIDYKQKITSLFQDHHKEEWLGIPRIRWNGKSHYCLKKIFSHRRHMQTTASGRLQTLKTVRASENT